MATTEFIAAIELGSSKITGVAGKRNSDGSMQILAYAQEDSTSVIHKGVVYNLDKTAQILTSIINRLEGELNGHIAKVYVGISGQSLRTVQNVIVRDLDEVTTISQELVDAISDENISIPLVDMDILEVVPQEYKVGNYAQADPVGVACSHIEGHFLNLVARAIVKKNLEKSFEQAKIEIADLVISPLATAKYLLNDNERRSGCALIDLGAETTTVSIYKGNLLRYLTVVPLGSNVITSDLASLLQIEEEEAEKIKLAHGTALYDEEPSDTPQTVTLDDGHTVELAHINDIINARMEEIVANAWNQMQLSGYVDKLFSGIVLTGGASNMKNLDAMFRKQCKIDKVRFARTGRLTVFADNEIIRKDATQNSIFGILFEGKDNCKLVEAPKPVVEEPAKPVQQPEPAVVQPEPKKEEEEKPTLFDHDDELRRQAEEARQAAIEARRLKDEEERKRKEAEKKRKDEEKRRREEERRKKKGPGFFGRLSELSKDIFSDTDMND